jgi:hypothetical protein
MRTSEMEMIAESDDGNLVHTVLLIMRLLCDLRGFFPSSCGDQTQFDADCQSAAKARKSNAPLQSSRVISTGSTVMYSSPTQPPADHENALLASSHHFTRKPQDRLSPPSTLREGRGKGCF